MMPTSNKANLSKILNVQSIKTTGGLDMHLSQLSTLLSSLTFAPSNSNCCALRFQSTEKTPKAEQQFRQYQQTDHNYTSIIKIKN